MRVIAIGIRISFIVLVTYIVREVYGLYTMHCVCVYSTKSIMSIQI